jgi:uncharacterized protein involved in type VI secretion and phage assembly
MRAGGPRSLTGDAALFGVYYAVVTQNKDDENKTRVKVRLPWLDQGDSDQTYWAQVSVPMEGQEFGWYTLPDVGDVVAVMFIAGDMSQPIIIGGIWSKADSSPEPNQDGANNFRGYRSRAGSRIVMDDSSSGKVYFADKTDKNSVTVGSFGKGGSGANARAAPTAKAINAAAQSGVSIASEEGEVQITAKGKLKIDAQNVEFQGEQSTDVKADGNAELEGAMATIVAKGQLKIAGSSSKLNG